LTGGNDGKGWGRGGRGGRKREGQEGTQRGSRGGEGGEAILKNRKGNNNRLIPRDHGPKREAFSLPKHKSGNSLPNPAKKKQAAKTGTKKKKRQKNQILASGKK